MIPIITIEGPTASGKSNLALELAQKLNTDLISADSRQVYKRLNIGTSKPTEEEQLQVHHHLIDVIDIRQIYTAGDFKDQAGEICEKLWDKKKIPIVVGGTGLYIRALLEGLFTIPSVPGNIKEIVRKVYESKGLEYLHHYLSEIDSEAASRISVNDRQRIIRAVEVFRFTGIPITEHWKKQDKTPKYKAFKILMDINRTDLYERIEKRLDTMMLKGILPEIISILDDGYQWSDPGLNAVGYKEFTPYFESKESLQNCLLMAKQHTRNYAKRQMTWYNRCEFNLTISSELINLSELVNSIEDSLSEIINN